MTLAANSSPNEAARLVLHERLKKAVQRVEGGPWDGVPIVTEKDVDIAFAEALPPPSSRAADVTTPARVIVSAVCPNCHIPQQIALLISPKLEIDDERKTLKLVAKAKSMGHTCGQQALPLPAEGQTEAFEEVAVEPDEAADDAELPEPPAETVAAPPARSRRSRRAAADDVDLGACPFPDCGLAADHPGPHATGAPDTTDPDSALLPE